MAPVKVRVMSHDHSEASHFEVLRVSERNVRDCSGRHSLGGSPVSEAQKIALACGGRWHGQYGTAPCPVCQPEARPGQNALTLADGTKGLVVHCKKAGCDFRAILGAVGMAPGVFATPDPVVIAQRAAERRKNAEKRAQQARALWNDAIQIRGTIAETYLRWRGITCPLPATLRLHSACWHGPTAQRLPALVARVDGATGFAVHRTWLRPDGNGKADISPPKAMLGATAGGAVRLTNAPGRLVVAEGIETALSLASGLLDGPATIWAALSTSGMVALRLPDAPGLLTIAPDGDKAGRGAALTLADRAARVGWNVSMLTPPENADFNDVLRGEVTP